MAKLLLGYSVCIRVPILPGHFAGSTRAGFNERMQLQVP